jgi:hypothetical protein
LQSAGLATSLLHKKWEGHVPSPLFERRQRQNRRAYGAAAGEKTGGDGCSHLKVPVFSPVTGDPIACHSAFKKLYRISHPASASLWGRVVGWNFVLLVSWW